MVWELYDYVDNRGRNDIKAWTQSLEKTQRMKLNSKLDMFEKFGSHLPPKLYSDTPLHHIKKIRSRGQVELRLLLSKGPIDNNKEFTLLLGAIEKNYKLEPRDAFERAERRRQEIMENPKIRRCLHEPVGK